MDNSIRQTVAQTTDETPSLLTRVEGALRMAIRIRLFKD
jgi:hypothetical protein